MPTIRPRLRLIDLCGPGYVFNSRVPDNAAQWVFETPAIADASTGNQLTVLGEMPVLCSAGAATTAGLALLRDAGFAVEAELVTYTDAADRRARMRALAARGLTFIDQHAQPDASLRPGASWVDPALLSSLNNKANLSHWVAAPHRPAREVYRRAALSRLQASPGRFPLIMKAATEASCGSGRGVRIVRDPPELGAALACFSACDSVIVEEYLAMQRNLCVNYAVFADGRIEYLGAAQQIINDRLRYLGNWLEPRDGQLEPLIQAGHDLMRRAYQAGYRGFAGFDAAIAADGSFRIYDLNFRFNGSTVPLLLYDALAQHTGLPVAKRVTWMHKDSFDGMLAALRRALERHELVPLGIFDPTRCRGGSDAVPRISAMLFGSSREEVREKEREVASLGFYMHDYGPQQG